MNRLGERPYLGHPTVVLGLGLLAFTGAVMAAAELGRLWWALGITSGVFLLAWCWLESRPFEYVAVVFLLASPLLMVLEPLKPEEFNYFAWAVGLCLMVAVALSFRNGGWPGGGMTLFLSWAFASAVVTTIRVHPEPVYGLVLGPLGLMGGYLLLRQARRPVRRFFLRGVLILGAIQAVIGLLQTFLGFPYFLVWKEQVFSEPRNYLSLFIPGLPTQVRMAVGTFEHFNGFGALMSLIVPIAFSRWQERKSLGRSLYLVLVIAGLISSFSRGALVGILAGILAIYLLGGRRSLPRVYKAAFLAGVAAVISLLTYSQIAEYSRSTGNLIPRLEAWGAALQYSLGSPWRFLFGTGYGFFGSGYLAEQGMISRLHSGVIQILTETGLVGFTLFAWAAAGSLRRAMRSSQILGVAFGASIIAFLASQAFDNALFGFQGLLCFALIGMIERPIPAAERDYDFVTGQSPIRSGSPRGSSSTIDVSP